MKTSVRYCGNMSFLGVSGTNHSVVMGASPESGGEGAAPSPMEMILLGLAGCSGMDVVSILKKKRIQFDAYEMEISGERADSHPKVFTQIHVDFVFTGRGLKEKPFEDAVRLSVEKYCSVAGMLSSTAEISWKVTLQEPEA